jgi:FMN phosphatase YigB (HAD superfamily)
MHAYCRSKILIEAGPLFRNPKTYLKAAEHLSLPNSKCAMVAAHLLDLRAAASCGMKTIYGRRPGEDVECVADVKTKKDGGEVDLVVDSFLELASILAHPHNAASPAIDEIYEKH